MTERTSIDPLTGEVVNTQTSTSSPAGCTHNPAGKPTAQEATAKAGAKGQPEIPAEFTLGLAPLRWRRPVQGHCPSPLAGPPEALPVRVNRGTY